MFIRFSEKDCISNNIRFLLCTCAVIEQLEVIRGHCGIGMDHYQSRQLHSLSNNFISFYSIYDREKKVCIVFFSMTLRLGTIVFSEDNL